VPAWLSPRLAGKASRSVAGSRAQPGCRREFRSTCGRCWNRIPRDQAPPPAWNTRFSNWPLTRPRALQPERGRIAFHGRNSGGRRRAGLFWQGRIHNVRPARATGRSRPTTAAPIHHRSRRTSTTASNAGMCITFLPALRLRPCRVSAARSISTTASSTPRDSKSPPPAAGMMPATCGKCFS